MDKYIFTTFDAITQPFIKPTLLKNKTIVLALILICETRAEKRDYIVLSYVIYTLIQNYFCIVYLACQSKILN